MSYFPTTIWDIVTSSTNRQSHFNEFARKYWAPVKEFIQKQGIPEHDAEDLTQDVFSTILQKDLLSKIYHKRGKFRSFIIAIAKRIILKKIEKKSALKRGGGSHHISFDEIEGIVADSNSEPDFDTSWMKSLLDSALTRLEKENPEHSELIKLFTNEKSFSEIAQIKRIDEKKARNMFDYAKSKLVEFIHQELSSYTLTHEEFQEELAILQKYFQANHS